MSVCVCVCVCVCERVCVGDPPVPKTPRSFSQEPARTPGAPVLPRSSPGLPQDPSQSLIAPPGPAGAEPTEGDLGSASTSGIIMNAALRIDGLGRQAEDEAFFGKIEANQLEFRRGKLTPKGLGGKKFIPVRTVFFAHVAC